MNRIRKPGLLSSLIAAASLMLVIVGFGALVFTQDQKDTERRFWPPNYRPAASKPSVKPRTGRYRRTTPALEKEAIPTAAEKESVVGITIWRLRPPVANEKDAARILRVRKGKVEESSFTAERVEASTAFTTGQMLRLSIEVPRSGYLYLIDREQYADGSVSEPYLVYPLDPVNHENRVEAGRVIEIPKGSDEPYFEVDPLRNEGKVQNAEILTVLVTPKPLEGLPKAVRNTEGGYDPIQLPEADVQKWERLWETQVEQLELEDGAGKVYTRSEQLAGAKRKRLTQNDPLPQTLFRVAAKPKSPLLVKLPLKIEK